MTALVKKEVRLLLPAWCVVLLVEAAVPWLCRDPDTIVRCPPVAFFLGLILLTVDAFGREFTLGTFPSLLSQPIERQRIWRTKISLLVVAAGLIALAYAASWCLRMYEAPFPVNVAWAVKTGHIQADLYQALLASGVFLLVALTNGLWATLLLRHTATAIWVAFLCPTLLLLLVALFLPNDLPEGATTALFVCLGVIYSLGGFWLARRLFRRAQDVGWSGGTITFSRWRYFERPGQGVISRREHRPWTALLKKEFQLHSVSLFCVGGLLAGHLCALIVRAYGRFHRDSPVELIANGFWIFWLAVPALIGCTTMAEERKLGMIAGQFCLPVSRARQFASKVLPAMIAGTLLGGGLPLLLELAAVRLGIPSDLLNPNMRPLDTNSYVNGYIVFLISVVVGALTLVSLGTLASSLAKNFLQALSLTLIGSVLILAQGSWAVPLTLGITPTPALVAVVVVPPAVLWLMWGNFNGLEEGWRLWRRNLLGLVGALAAMVALSGAVYFRAWEVFKPAEPPHGPARLVLADAPRLAFVSEGNLALRWPAGQVCLYNLGFSAYQDPDRHWPSIWSEVLGPPMPRISGSGQLMGGSNWVSFSAWRVDFWAKGTRVDGYFDTVGVKRDGTLWLAPAGKAWDENKLQPVGHGTNWRQVDRSGNDFVLLKADGTLWWWSLGTNRWDLSRDVWPTVQSRPLVQLGTNSDWKELSGESYRGCLARKNDGSTWSLASEGRELPGLVRWKDLDEVVLRTFSEGNGGDQAYIGADGVLRVRIKRWRNDGSLVLDTKFLPSSPETNWLTVAFCWNWAVALNGRGELWKWDLFRQEDQPEFYKQKPVRLGIHNDWVGLGESYNRPVSLAADGTLWLWPGTDRYEFALMRPPKQPQRLGNIFDAPNE